jgi:hypothetical protein
VVFGQRFAEVFEDACRYWRGRLSIGDHPWPRQKVAGMPPPLERHDVFLFSQPEQPVREGLRALALAPLLPCRQQSRAPSAPRNAPRSTIDRMSSLAGHAQLSLVALLAREESAFFGIPR